jgi:transcriptional regulator with XRE-family HTH domain
MRTKNHDRAKMNRVLRDTLLEASELELREALRGTPEDFDELAARGRAAAQRALATTDDTADVQDLHRGLGALIQMLRRRDHVSIDELATQARVDINELRRIELNAAFEPNPRTICQLEQYFKLPARSFVILSGAVRVDSDVRAEAVRFAASSENIAGLSREERKLLNRFVKFLREHTDE